MTNLQIRKIIRQLQDGHIPYTHTAETNWERELNSTDLDLATAMIYAAKINKLDYLTATQIGIPHAVAVFTFNPNTSGYALYDLRVHPYKKAKPNYAIEICNQHKPRIIPRHYSIIATYRRAPNDYIDEHTWKGFGARIIQHAYDHLAGNKFTDLGEPTT